MILFTLALFANPDAITTTGAMGWGAVVIAGCGLITVVVSYLTTLITGGKTLIGRIDELNARQWKLQDELTQCKTDLGQCKGEHAASKVENVQLKADLERTQNRVSAIESFTGVVPNIPSIPGVVIADKNGIILEFSPALTPWLGWLPSEMYGKNIDVLVPPDQMQSHREGFAKAFEPGAVIDPTRKIQGYVLDKAGKSVPVTISVRKWAGVDGHVSATLLQRPLVGTLPPGTPQRRMSDV